MAQEMIVSTFANFSIDTENTYWGGFIGEISHASEDSEPIVYSANLEESISLDAIIPLVQDVLLVCEGGVYRIQASSGASIVIDATDETDITINRGGEDF